MAEPSAQGISAEELRRHPALSDPAHVIGLLGLHDGSEPVSGGRVIRCVFHADSGRPNLSVTRRHDGTISVKCFSCQATGDVLHLIAAARGITSGWHSHARISGPDFQRVLREAASLAGAAPAPPMPRQFARRKDFPPVTEVRGLWESCLPLTHDDQLVDQLRARGLDAAALTKVARAIPRVASFPRWAAVRQEERRQSWAQAGYRLILPMWNAQGMIATLHARRFAVAQDERKGTNPAGCTFVGSVLSNLAGLHALQGSKPLGRIIICEGAPDFLVLCTQWQEEEGVAVFGIISGSWTQALADRIPDASHVTIWTHTDAQRNKAGALIKGAGQLYAEKVARTLAPRCAVYVVHQERPEHGKAPDINDVLLAGGRAAVLEMLLQARPWSDRTGTSAPLPPPWMGGPPPAEEEELPPLPGLPERWEQASGLVGLPVEELLRQQGLDPADVEERDLLRVLDGKPSTRSWSRKGELRGFIAQDTERGLIADPLGQHLLRTGQAPPGGVLITSGLINFLTLATQWEPDDPTAPAIFAGGLPVVPEGTRLIAWPASAVPAELEEVEIVTAGLPSVALRVGGRKAVRAGLDAAQPAPRREKDPEPPEPRIPPQQGWPRTDFGNAERLVHHFGTQIRYVGDWESWFTWDGRRWQRDRTGATMRMAKATARLIPEEMESAEKDQAKWIRKWSLESEGQGRLRAMMALASSEQGIPVVPERLDADPYLLNVRNGTLDLRTGTLLPQDRKHLITKIGKVSFDPRATCPTWLRFLHRIMDGNERLIAFIKRALGYSLTGDVGAHVFFVLYGVGRNGKSTLLLTLQQLLGDYARQAAPDLLMDNGRGDAQSPGRAAALAALQGARLVVASETERGGRLAEASVKAMVSGDTISAKFMGRDWFEFPPTHHIFLATNHRPTIKGKDPGIWEKVKLIPFKITIPREERDRTLPARLLGELPGILNWCLEGCLEWQSAGLGEPPEVEEAVQGYQQKMDLLRDFLADVCLLGKDYSAKIGALRKAYEIWCAENSDDPVGVKTFGQLLEEKGFPSDSDGTARFRKGLMIKGDWMQRIIGDRGQRSSGGGQRED